MGTKVYINVLSHMTKIAAMPIYGKNHKNLLLWNQWIDFNETWYVALGTLAHYILYKSCPLVVLDLLYDKLNFGYIGFSMKKK